MVPEYSTSFLVLLSHDFKIINKNDSYNSFTKSYYFLENVYSNDDLINFLKAREVVKQKNGVSTNVSLVHLNNHKQKLKISWVIKSINNSSFLLVGDQFSDEVNSSFNFIRIMQNKIRETYSFSQKWILPLFNDKKKSGSENFNNIEVNGFSASNINLLSKTELIKCNKNSYFETMKGNSNTIGFLELMEKVEAELFLQRDNFDINLIFISENDKNFKFNLYFQDLVLIQFLLLLNNNSKNLVKLSTTVIFDYYVDSYISFEIYIEPIYVFENNPLFLDDLLSNLFSDFDFYFLKKMLSCLGASVEIKNINNKRIKAIINFPLNVYDTNSSCR